MRVIGIMMIMMLFSCNSGTVEEESNNKDKFLKSVVSISNDFINIFTSFGEMVGSVLGFNTETKKSEVGAYFKKIQDTVQGTKDKLNKIVTDMKSENNPNATGVETAVTKLVSEKLDKIIDGAKTVNEAIGDTGEQLVANVADQNAGSAGTEVEKLANGIKSIVEVVLKEGKHDAGDDKGPVKDDGTAAGAQRAASGAGADGDAGKLFIQANAGAKAVAAKAAKDASKAVGSVRGADILKAISTGVNGIAAKLAKETTGNSANAKDAEVAGGIALRAMAKNGKFSNASDGDTGGAIATTVKGAVLSAVTKALNTLTIAIRKTVDAGLKEVKEAMKINLETTSVTTEFKNQ